MPDAGILATIMLLIGLILLGVEFFIPSFGMIFVCAALSLIVSLWAACKAWWGTNPGFFWSYIFVLVGGIPVSVFGTIALMQKSTFGSRMTLPPAPSADKLPPNPLEEHIGRRGTAQNLMTPGGIILLDSERFHAESPGMVVEPGTKIIVIGARANRLLVRPLLPSDEQTARIEPASEQLPEVATSDVPSSDKDPEPEPLDFDIPDDYTDRQK
ncbi:MAG: NfeD family protein [Planctomycetaceae bacterium]|nr:NfeD family protein [Planctomycetaceae bacterium]